MNRRGFLTTGLAAGTGVVSASAASINKQSSGKIKIVGISCSPRKGKTTATAVKIALDAAKEVDPHLEVELIDLGGKQIAGWSETVSQAQDDFVAILPKLKDPDLGGIIIGSPS